MEDMTQEERDEAGFLSTQEERGQAGHVSRRVEKLGKAFQNWRRTQLHLLAGMKIKVTFLAWRVFLNEEKVERGESRTEEVPVCEEELLWTEDDMDHFVHTVASFETHKRIWKENLQKRLAADPYDNYWAKPMPRMIPPSYVRLFQITLSQVHSAKFRQHFGAMAMDGTLVKPFHMHVDEELAEPATTSCFPSNWTGSRRCHQ